MKIITTLILLFSFNLFSYGQCTLPSSAITAGGPTTFCSGGSVTLNASTEAGLSYEWRVEGLNISGATSDSYVASESGTYDCFLTNSCGSVISNSIVVTAPSPGIVAHGSTSFCSPGGYALLSANTGMDVTYQWRLEGVDISGETSNSIIVTTPGSYSCLITNACGTFVSNSISTFAIIPPQAMITVTGPTYFCNSGSVWMNANPGEWYTWQRNGITISGATSDFYLAQTAGSYTVTVSNECGASTVSSPVNVTMGGAAPVKPAVINGPSTFCSGQSGVVYSIDPVPDAFSYVWLISNGNITSGQYTTSITVTFGDKGGKIRVLATNSCGNSNYEVKNVHKNCREGGESIEDIFPELTVFPNPSSSGFTLNISDADQDVVLIVRDMTGRELEQKNLAKGILQVEFGFDLPAGIYLAEIVSGENRKLVKLIRQGY